MSSMNKKCDLSKPSFLFSDNNNSKKVTQFCQNKVNINHDSSYLWCKQCNLILCYNCSMNHLLNNQIDHSFNKIFLSKELLDIEYYKDFSKIETLQKLTEEFFNSQNISLSNAQKNNLNDLIKKINDIKNEFIAIIDNFINKMTNMALESINKKDNNNLNDIFKKNENNIKNDMNAIISKYNNILNKYTKSQEFNPNNIKLYHDELFDVYKNVQIFVKELSNMKKSRNNIIIGIESRFDIVKKNLTNGINYLQTFNSNFMKFINEIKI